MGQAGPEMGWPKKGEDLARSLQEAVTGLS